MRTSEITIVVDGVPHRVRDDVSLAVALLNVGVTAFRRDHEGQARAPVCGMGTCHECRVTVDAVQNVRSCLEPVHDGMMVETGA
jgi:aerobic-type carbon monoxide dehydrogenase small subunit (CoxS/CutS family)